MGLTAQLVKTVGGTGGGTCGGDAAWHDRGRMLGAASSCTEVLVTCRVLVAVHVPQDRNDVGRSLVGALSHFPANSLH